MPIIEVMCLPRLAEDLLHRIHRDIVEAAVAIPELGLKDENDMTVLFPSNTTGYSLGEKIIIRVTGLFEKPSRTELVRNELAASIGHAVRAQFPTGMIECFIFPFNPQQGFWTSKQVASRGDVERILVAAAKLKKVAEKTATTMCSCTDDRICGYHRSVNAYKYYGKRAVELLSIKDTKIFQPLADAYVDEILNDAYVCDAVRHELGTKPV